MKKKQKIAHCWIGKSETYKPDIHNPDYCTNHPGTCVHVAYAGERGYATHHITMLAHYQRRRDRAGIKTVWHNHAPHWLKIADHTK